MRKSTIIGVLLACGLAVAGCTPSERPSNQPPAPGTPPPTTGVHQAPAQGEGGQ